MNSPYRSTLGKASTINTVCDPQTQGHIQVFVKNLGKKAIIDTGSSSSIISPSLVKNVMPTADTLSDITGSRIQVVGKAPVTLDLGFASAMKQEFLVAEIDHAPILLGANFIKNFGLSIDFGNNFLIWNSECVPFIPNRELKPKTPESKAVAEGFHIKELNLDTIFLVDSGATKSVISKKLLPHEDTCGKIIESASGKQLEITGEVLLKLDLGFDQELDQIFLVANNLTVEAVLGADFLKNHKMILHGKEQKLEWHGKTVPLTYGKISPSLDVEVEEVLDSVLAIQTLKNQDSENFLNLINLGDFGEESVLARRCRALLKQFPRITLMPTYHQPPRHPIYLHIVLSDYSPLRQKARACTPEQRLIVRDNFVDQVQRDVAIRGSPSHVSPTTIVTKKNGEPRVCIDYTRLNRLTEWINYPLPKMNDLTSTVTPRHKIFSVIDLKEAYFSIPLSPQASQLAGIITPDGAFLPKRCQFGLKNAPFKFCELIDHVTHGLKSFVFTYLDDFLIFSENEEDHLDQLSKLFTRLDEYGLFINVKKCLFARESVPFLGRIVSSQGVHLEKEKINHILSQKPPTTLKELRGFLGLVNHYRPHLPHLSETAEPLTNLLQGPKRAKRSPIPWNGQCEESFLAVLSTIENSATLGFDDPLLPLILSTDASQFHAGATLEQDDPKGKNTRRPLAFFSKALPKGKVTRSAFNRELCAMRMAVQHFRHQIRGRRLVILTDHKALVHALNNGVGQHSPLEIAWLDEIREYCPEVMHVKGENNPVADFMSRPPGIPTPEVGTSSEHLTHVMTDSSSPIQSHHLALTTMPGEDNTLSLSILRDLQQDDVSLRDFEGTPGWEEREFDGQDGERIKIVGVRNEKTPSFRPYVPQSLRPVIYHQFHTLAHMGGEKTLEVVECQYFWPSIKKDILHWSAHCPQCQQNKVTRHNRQSFSNFPDEPGRLNILHVDLVGPLPSVVGCPYILTMRDRNTGFLITTALEAKTSEKVIAAIEQNCLAKFGVPDTFITDQGREFCSQRFSLFCASLGINHRQTNAYHPQANGFIERIHRMLKSSIRSLDDPADWQRSLPYFTLQLNNQVSGKNCFTPFQITFGKAGKLPGVLVPNASEVEQQFSETNVKIFMDLMLCHNTNQRPLRDNHPYLERDLFTVPSCWVRDDSVKSPVAPLYRGPYEVLTRGPKTFVLSIEGKTHSISVDRLKAHKCCEDPACLHANGLAEAPSSEEPQTIPPCSSFGRPLRSPDLYGDYVFH